MKINLSEIGKDDKIPEGIYSIATKDLGAQYFMVRRQHHRAYFAPGQLCVYKVEVVKSPHEEVMYRDAKWNIWYSDTMEQTLAYKMFAFASNQGVYVWKKYQDRRYPLANAKTISDTPATIEITMDDIEQVEAGGTAADGLPPGDVKLWMAYAKVLWEFVTRAPNSDISRTDTHTICKNISAQIPGGAVRTLEDGEMRHTRHKANSSLVANRRRRW